MATIDWTIVALYCVITIVIGFVLTKKASGGMADYFASGRSLPWWIAGTSIVATTFSSDTPLFVTKLVREKGIWGNWEWWGLMVSSMMAVFFFSRLWKRAGVLTEVELVELRYSGKPSSALRGFKSIYWGVFYNCVLIGGMPVIGLVKVMQITTGWDKTTSIIFCMVISTAYCTFSGLWGVVINDVFQFVLAMVGAIILAVYAVDAAGGLSQIMSTLSATDKLAFIPQTGGDFWTSSFTWFIALICIQWWAYKNTDGGGVIVQRIVASKDEKNAIYGMLWFNIAHYALRSWPWILAALASIILIKDPIGLNGKVDHELAYPLLITTILPAGLKGLLIASFFAAFMSTVDAYMNWGASYIMNDLYKRFIRPNKSERHYVFVSRIASVLIMALATLYAFYAESVETTFQLILNFTAGIGVVNLARWFWWRVNAWSEITTLIVSIPAILLQKPVAIAFGVITSEQAEIGQKSLLFNLLFMIGFTALFWIPATLLTKPVDIEKLKEFYKRTRPPGPGWKKVKNELLADDLKEGAKDSSLKALLLLWLVGIIFILTAMLTIGKLLLADYTIGIIYLAVCIISLIIILKGIKRQFLP